MLRRKQTGIMRVIGIALVLVVIHALLMQRETLQQSTVHAQSEVPGSTNCVGLDLVVLLDQSSSMKTNDPNQLRIEALAQIVDQLGDNHLYFCPEASHRLAVIGFGDVLQAQETESSYLQDVRVYFDSVVIAPSELGAWINERAQIKSKLPSPENLKGTDFVSAFRAAHDVFQKWDSQKMTGVAKRRKVVLVITDGGPCILNEGCGSNPSYGGEQIKHHMEDLEKYLDPNGKYFPWRGEGNAHSVAISVVALHDESRADYNYIVAPEVGGVWKRITEEHGGSFEPVATDRPENLRLSTQIYDTLSPFFAITLDSWECKKPLWVNPYDSSILIIQIWRVGALQGYLPQNVRIQLVHTGLSGQTTFERGNSSNPTFSVADYTSTGLSERYVFYKPWPGKYEVKVEGADLCLDVDVRYGRDPIRVKVISPNAENGTDVLPTILDKPHYDQSLLPQFKVELFTHGENGDIVPLLEDANFPLNLTVHVKQPDGMAVDYPLVRSVDEPGVYVSQDYIRTPVSGTYQWLLEGTTLSPQVVLGEAKEAAPVIVASVAGQSFRAAEVTRFDVRFTPVAPSPINVVQSDGTMTPLPFDVEFSLVGLSEGKDVTAPLDPQRVFENPEQPFQLELYGPEGNLIETVPARLVDAGEGLFKATFRKESTILDPAGEYRVRLIRVSSYDRFAFAPAFQEREITIPRYLVYPVQAVVETEPEQLIHSSLFWESVKGVVLPLNIRLRFRNYKSGETLPPGDVILSGVPNAEIRTPAGEVLQGAFEVGDDNTSLVWKSKMTPPAAKGEYAGVVDLSAVQVAHGYVLLQEKVPFQFVRTDTYRSDPTVTRAIATTAGIVVLAVLGWLIGILFFGPQGSLEVVNWKGEVIAGPWQLKRIPSRNVIRDIELQAMDIEKIYVWRARERGLTEGENQRAVRVRVLDVNHAVVIDDILMQGEPFPLSNEGDLVLK